MFDKTNKRKTTSPPPKNYKVVLWTSPQRGERQREGWKKPCLLQFFEPNLTAYFCFFFFFFLKNHHSWRVTCNLLMHFCGVILFPKLIEENSCWSKEWDTRQQCSVPANILLGQGFSNTEGNLIEHWRSINRNCIVSLQYWTMCFARLCI